jgi:nucleotide-binding universal stress UspA family protein
MQKVLLAVDGIKPTEKAFRYAVELCQRMRADLRVVQVIRPGQNKEYLKRVRKGAHRAKCYIENFMMAVTFAEASEHRMANEIMTEIMTPARMNTKQLLPESKRAGISCHLTMASGLPGKEIIRYVNEHRDVVLTIYDTAVEENSVCGISAEEGDGPLEITQRLSIPLVVMRS